MQRGIVLKHLGHGHCSENHMITFVLSAYAVITVLFVAGLAAAAGRPVPEMDNVIALPVNMTEETESSLEKAA